MDNEDDLKMINSLIDILDEDWNSVFFFFIDKQYEKIIDEMKASLVDMYYNFDDRFINKFKECCSECNPVEYFNNMNIVGCFFNMYVILKAYELQKENFENFSCIMDDIGFKIERTPLLFQFESDFLNCKVIVDYIVGLYNYTELTNLRKFFLDILNVSRYSYNELIDLISVVSSDILDLEKNGYKVNNDVILDIIDYRFDSAVDFCNIKYSPILLIGDRFKYINNALVLIEKNVNFRNEIFTMIKDLSIDLFNGDDNDLFMKCMQRVFDSNSYYELVSKMDCLTDASALYDSGEEKKALSMIEDLDSDCHKAIYCGKIVNYPDNTMNKIIKPIRIIDRMKQLYSRIDNSISYDFIGQIDFNCSIRDVSVVIEKRIEKEKLPFIKAKKKVKRLIEKNKSK